VTRVIVFSSLLALASLVACGGKARPVKIAASNAVIGECADPESAGVLSSDPKLRDASRDLNGDSKAERVVADKSMCRDGNCYWNLFVEQEGCYRYIGTIAGASIEMLKSSSDSGYRDLRGWWKLPGGSRQLVQNYRFRDRGYQLADVLLCRQGDDDRLQCASEERSPD
jgi:hypothetical protein